MPRITGIVMPVALLLLALVLAPLFIQLIGGAADAAGQTFNGTVQVTDNTSVNLGGLAKLLIMLAGLFVIIALIEKALYGGW